MVTPRQALLRPSRGRSSGSTVDLVEDSFLDPWRERSAAKAAAASRIITLLVGQLAVEAKRIGQVEVPEIRPVPWRRAGRRVGGRLRSVRQVMAALPAIDLARLVRRARPIP